MACLALELSVSVWDMDEYTPEAPPDPVIGVPGGLDRKVKVRPVQILRYGSDSSSLSPYIYIEDSKNLCRIKNGLYKRERYKSRRAGLLQDRRRKLELSEA
jgi:hypothetical protein